MFTIRVYRRCGNLSTGAWPPLHPPCVDRALTQKYNSAPFLYLYRSFGCAKLGVVSYETNLPTKPPQTGAYPRFPCAHGDAQRPEGLEGAAGQGSPTPDPLKGRPRRADLPRSARLGHARDYERVFASSVKSVDDYFTVLATSNEGHGARLGLAMSKRCAPRAVQRTRLRRIVRESFRLRRATLCALDLVVLCRRPALRATNQTLSASLAAHWIAIFHQLCASS
jgi:ribonuclease P protein component